MMAAYHPSGGTDGGDDIGHPFNECRLERGWSASGGDHAVIIIVDHVQTPPTPRPTTMPGT